MLRTRLVHGNVVYLRINYVISKNIFDYTVKLGCICDEKSNQLLSNHT